MMSLTHRTATGIFMVLYAAQRYTYVYITAYVYRIIPLNMSICIAMNIRDIYGVICNTKIYIRLYHSIRL